MFTVCASVVNFYPPHCKSPMQSQGQMSDLSDQSTTSGQAKQGHMIIDEAAVVCG